MAIPLTLAVGSKVFQRNRIFASDPGQIRDRANACFVVLKEEAERLGFVFATEDIHPVGESKIVVDFNVQKWTPGPLHQAKRYLITLEPPVTFRQNWLHSEHQRYDKVFTWDDDLVDNEKYFLLRYAHNLGVAPDLPTFQSRSFAATVIGFKASVNSQELYSERLKTVHWFLANHPDKFALYGAGWPHRLRPYTAPRLEQFLSAPLNLLVSPFFKVNQCYRGPCADKVATLSQYRFAFCYENTDSANGYTTEKIFDAFRAGCVPVYLGPPNVAEMIPEDCFIDRRKYQSHEQLFARLCSISESEFLAYQQRIRRYLAGDQARQFTPGFFTKVLLQHITADLGIVQSSVGECEPVSVGKR